MRYLFILIFLSFQLNAQILRPEPSATDLIIEETLKLNQKMFKQPSFMQPVVYISYSPLFPGLAGLTRKLSDKIYMVDLNPMYSKDVLEKVLMHELVHVYQMDCNKLEKTKEGFRFNGILYSFKFPYKLRPWEIEANQRVSEICD